MKTGIDCDRPALPNHGHASDGQCAPGSRILNLSTETEHPDQPIDGTLIASPTMPNTPPNWADPEAVVAGGCGNRHDNDPFMYSPFVGQVWDAVPANLWAHISILA